MASLISGDLVEAYVRRNACKEEMRRAEANTVDGGAAAQGEKKAGDGAPGKETAQEAAGGKQGDGGGLFGSLKKKVHPKADGTGTSY